MATHTIALFGDWLMATAPDDRPELLAARVNAGLAEIWPDEVERDRAREVLRFESGLTLFERRIDAEDADAVIVYAGTDQGWLEDEHGRMIYEVAARARPATA
jgi:hypothetical protein